MALRADDVDLGRDRDLVARFQNGDPEAFDDLYRRYFDRLHRFCLRQTRDSHEAEEIAQEAFVKALRSMHTLEGERRFYPWMTVIAKRLTIDRHRKLSRIELTDEPDVGSVDPDVEHLFAEVDAAHVREAMHNLGPRHREVLELREAEGMSYGQIAGHLDVPLTTVEALLHRARKALRREYAAVGGERRGLLGLPLFGWLTTRIADLRVRAGDRWVEASAVMAPLAVGAATAAVVLSPSPDDGSTRVDTTASTAAVVDIVDTTTTATAAPLEVPETTATTNDDTPPASTTTAPAPAVEAGPVDLFIGREGAEHAREAAEDMPVAGTVGPATGGADLNTAARSVETFIDDTTTFIVGVPGDDTVEDRDDRPAAILDPLLGGTP